MDRLKFWRRKLNPIPKIIIGFHTFGCMDTGRELKWIGHVTKEWLGGDDHCPVDFYDVQPIITMGIGENRDQKEPLPKVQAWQIQHLWLNLYIFYDA
jgi:hypothetical protein